MQEIKFRAWDKDKREMRDVTGINWYDEYIWVDETPMSGDKLPIESTPLMQYTGLKDKNGKEIYEGDVVRLDEYEDGMGEWQVVFDEASFFLEQLGAGDEVRCEILGTCDSTKDVEIIGNIYDNPDLIK